MKLVSRRTCLQRLALMPVLGAATWSPRGSLKAAEAALAAGEEEAIKNLADGFLKEFDSPGLSVAFAHERKLVFRRGFGLADRRGGEALTVDHRFRIASISKPVTAVTVYGLIEAGQLTLDAKVFGKEGLLPRYRTTGDRERLEAVTVHHLLTHTCGGWGNDAEDPMFTNPAMDHDELIAWTLREVPLQKTPGEAYAYSNFGYCVLGRVIEKVTKKPYAEAVQELVLGRCSIRGMQIAGNTMRERAKDEVVYHGQEGQDPYGMNVRRMDAHGGWLASPTDLLRFLVQVDGFDKMPDILKPASIATMTAPGPAGGSYASGWSVNKAPNWWHGGSLPGTSTIAVRTAGGLCWAGFANTRVKEIGGALDGLMWKMVAAVPAWRA